MLKRTKGRILLTMLVITGLAGTINDTTLSSQERKFAISQLKNTKTDLLTNIKGLSETQLNFKPSAEKWSIKECLYHLSLAEKGLWDKLEAVMKEPANPEKRSELKMSDEELLNAITNPSAEANAPEPFQPDKVSWQSISEAVSAFKSSRAQHLKYVKTTTGDLRNHFILLPSGWVDCYQFIIFISGHCNHHTRQINEILTDPGFPEK